MTEHTPPYPVAFLANRDMIARGRGHAVVHDYH
jgi:hypothetical protein